MGPEYLAATVVIVVAAIAAWGVVRIAKIRIQSYAAADPDTAARLQTLEQEVAMLRQEVGETHERLDFAERVLAKRPETRRLSPEG